MYNNNKILTGVISAVLFVAVALGILFGLGVFDKKKDTLVISYPSKNIEWVETSNGIMAHFDKKITVKDAVNKGAMRTMALTFNVNDYEFAGREVAVLREDNDIVGLTYELFAGEINGQIMNEEDPDNYINYRIYFKLYNNAEINNEGVIVAGDGFVFEVYDLALEDSETGTYEAQKITKFSVLSMYQDTINVLM